MIDYTAVVADLTETREVVGAALEALLRLTGRALLPQGPAPVRRLPAVPRRAPKVHAKTVAKPATAPRVSALKAAHVTAPSPQLAKAKALAAREGLRAAADQTGISYQTLWGRARREHWPLPPSGKRAARTALTPAARGGVASVESKDTPLRVCEGCERRVTADPCPHCGKVWHRGDR